MHRILAIEDDQTVLRQIIETLTEADNYEVKVAQDGISGLELAHSFAPSLILCSTTLSEPDGYSVLRRVRRDPAAAHIPFIFLSQNITWTAIRQGMDMGADDHIIKPFTPEMLMAAVEARLRRYGDIMEFAERGLDSAKQRLMQMVTHELRTPLVPIIMAVEIVSRQMGQLDQAQLEELLDTISVGSRRLSRLIEQMVFITQLEAGALRSEKIRENGLPLRLWDLLVVAVDLARRFAVRHPDVSVRLDERDTEPMILADKSALKHALAELITNALSFSPPGGEVIIAEWQTGNEAWISIMDRGPGIPEDQLQRALEGFNQIDRETQDQQGIGLGLPLAHGIIQAHGGTLELRSEVGKGTKVTVGLPIAQG